MTSAYVRVDIRGNDSMEKVGLTIREERRKRNLTLEQLSQKTGLSKSFLSQIERGISEPSMTSLKKIAYVFGMSVVSLFVKDANQNANYDRFPPANENGKDGENYINDIKIVRAGHRKTLSLPGAKIVYELLTSDLRRHVEAVYMKIDPNETSGDEPMKDPPGEKLCIVLKGSLEVKVEDETHQLHGGDTIYFPAHFTHSWKGLGNHTIEVIWVSTPPCF
jgi:transcriptional regulator with XRE-family HTH domain